MRGLMDSANIPVTRKDEVDATYCLQLLYQIRDVVISTVDEDGLPASRVIEVMYADEERLYFLVPRGKALYSQLKRNPVDSNCAQTTDIRMCRLRGPTIRPKDDSEQRNLVDWLFALNPDMNMLYPGDSRYVIDVFYIEEGEGDYYDLGQKPLLRVPFHLGGAVKVARNYGFHITNRCTKCGVCAERCPQKCIAYDESSGYKIEQSECLHCGLCAEACPADAIEKGAVS